MNIPKICSFYNTLEGCRYDQANDQTCPHLHLCRRYILDNCYVWLECKLNHDMLNSHTQNILQKHGIDTKRPQNEILAELRNAQSTEVSHTDGRSVSSGPVPSGSDQPPYLRLPPVKRGVGLKKYLKRRRIQMIPHALDSQHSVSRQAENAGARSKTLETLGLSGQTGSSQTWPRSSSTTDLTGTGEIERVKSERICLYHLRKGCLHGQLCPDHHYDLPYQWQYRKNKDDAWQNCDFDSQKEIELSYSHPKYSKHVLKMQSTEIKVQFALMEGVDSEGCQYDVRRLSTPSSCEVEQQPISTVWVWYWNEEKDKWKEYGSKRMTVYEATVTSEDLEKAYLFKPEVSQPFTTEGFSYVLDFKKMVQINQITTKERAVCRRPVFVSKDEFQKRLESIRNNVAHPAYPADGSSNVDLHPQITPPQHWDIQPGVELSNHFRLYKIVNSFPATRKEYDEIEKQFCKSMLLRVSIKSIERIENGELWINYVSKKARMRKNNNDRDVEERQLFHGTKGKYAEAICKQGFDFRLSGMTAGTRFGKGSYFALESRYSNKFTDKSDRMMFIVKVLVGDYTLGTATLVRPPAKDPTNRCSDLYDSCVDNVHNPTRFVIFDNNGQVYPEYLVKYDIVRPQD